jgi:hypothetical protein
MQKACDARSGKYQARFSSNQRGLHERKLDLLKIAHYAGVAFNKIVEAENAAD